MTVEESRKNDYLDIQAHVTKGLWAITNAQLGAVSVAESKKLGEAADLIRQGLAMAYDTLVES